jgi:hypothetical protein
VLLTFEIFAPLADFARASAAGGDAGEDLLPPPS